MLELARVVLADLDVEEVLRHALESAVALTGAQYAAIGILDASRSGLQRFVTLGIDEEQRQAIGPLPRGRGLLGELITNPAPLRIADLGRHPRSYGFPSSHPAMTSFLGVPVHVGGVPFGNLYLTEKQGASEFTEDDESAVVLLAEFVGVALDHAQRFSGVDAHRSELARTVAALDASLQISRALGTEVELDSVLELVAKRGRALVDARMLVIETVEDDDLVIAAGAGDLPLDVLGRRIPIAQTLAGAALRSRRTQRVEEEANRARFREGLGRYGLTAQVGLAVPLIFRGDAYGVLVAVDRLDGNAPYTEEERHLLEAFAASAATAIATAESVSEEQRRQWLATTEAERRRWARELHDQTLQGLASLKILLAGGLQAKDPVRLEEAAIQAVEYVQTEITALRSLITDLRPATLDDLGVQAAVESLARRAASQGVTVTHEIRLAYELGLEPTRHTPEMETAMYRIVQEALTNARKHGKAANVHVTIHEDDHRVRLEVTDDGEGFDPDDRTEGFGLLGMRERAGLLDGTIELASRPGRGTTVTATLPVRARRPAEAAPA